MLKSASEIFNTVFEEVIIPIMDEMMREDYGRAVRGESKLCQDEAEFIKFRGAFEQRIKLFYFRQFTKYKAEGQEKFFPGNVERIEKDIHFLYVEFKSFLKEQRLKSNKERS
jgi:hypothetical protein